jgi:GGDEF domain-containing protein
MCAIRHPEKPVTYDFVSVERFRFSDVALFENQRVQLDSRKGSCLFCVGSSVTNLIQEKMELLIFLWSVAFLITAGYAVQTIRLFKKLEFEEAARAKAYEAQQAKIALLEKFAVIDPVTQFLNSRGFQIQIYKEQSRLLLGQELIFCVIQVHCVMETNFELASSENLAQGIAAVADVLRDRFPLYYGIGHLGDYTFAVVIPPGVTNPMDQSQIAYIQSSVSDTLLFLTGTEAMVHIGIGHTLDDAWADLARDMTGTQ